MNMIKSVFLINLGTPDSTDARSVRRYLREFLNDPRVIDLPSWIRWPLVNFIIVPLRYKKTAALYQKIWSKLGSPLLLNSQLMQQDLAIKLGSEYQVEIGMRYGNPNIPSVLQRFKKSDTMIVIPLFPQYSSAANGSAIEKLFESLSSSWNIPNIRILNDFYQHPGFIRAFAEKIKNTIEDKKVDLVLFSYHGLPERHIQKSDCQAQCDHVNACPIMNRDNRFCYRSQCYATTQLIAKELKWNASQYAVSFQSRLGRTPWIKPYTDLLLPELRKKGIKHIAMVSPSFVADCLETLEEMNIRTRKQWLELGGTDFTFIPCINNDPLWINALAEMVTRTT